MDNAVSRDGLLVKNSWGEGSGWKIQEGYNQSHYGSREHHFENNRLGKIGVG